MNHMKKAILEEFFARPFTTERSYKIIITSVTLVLLCWFLRSFSYLVFPFFLAWIMGVVIMPIVHFVQHKLHFKSRIISILFVLLFFLGVGVGVIALLIPSLLEESRRAWELFSYYFSPDLILSLVPDPIRHKIENTFNLRHFFEDLNAQEVLQHLQTLFQKSWSLLSGTLNVVSWLAGAAIFLLYLFFILVDMERLNNGALNLFPKSWQPLVQEVCRSICYYVNSYFRGQALIALICGVLFATGFYIMGLPLGITYGLFLGVLNLVPYMQLFGLPPLVILCMLQAASTEQSVWLLLLIAFTIIGVVQLLQDLVLTPTIMGKKMGMRPAIILLSLTFWGALFGFWGLLFALPLTMICYSLYMKYIIGETIEDNTAPSKRKKTTTITDTVTTEQ